MKRFLILALALVFALGAFGCSGQEGTAENDPINDVPLADIMAAIIKDATSEIATSEGDVDSERFAWFFGIDAIEGATGYSSEALISAVAHSVALLRVPDGVDVADVASQIEQKADPRKWVCVEAEKTIVKTRGNVVLLVMSEAAIADQIAANFDAYQP